MVWPFSTLKVRRTQILRRHALEHHAGGLLVADIGRHLDGAIGRNVALGRIAAEREHRGDTIADLDVGHVPGRPR